MAPESLAADLLLGVGQVELELGIQVALVGIPLLGIMDVPVRIDLFQDRAHIAVVGLDDGGGEAVVGQVQLEIDFGERVRDDRERLAVVTDQLRRQNLGLRFAGFEGVVAVHIGRDADRRAVEENGAEGDSFAGVGIRDAALDLGGLGSGENG